METLAEAPRCRAAYAVLLLFSDDLWVPLWWNPVLSDFSFCPRLLRPQPIPMRWVVLHRTQKRRFANPGALHWDLPHHKLMCRRKGRHVFKWTSYFDARTSHNPATAVRCRKSARLSPPDASASHSSAIRGGPHTQFSPLVFPAHPASAICGKSAGIRTGFFDQQKL